MPFKQSKFKPKAKGGKSANAMRQKESLDLGGYVVFNDVVISLIGVRGVETESHVALGVELMAKGQFVDALSHFHAAIDTDPEDYLTYYRRATVYLALGRSRTALSDLELVIKFKPDFLSAWVQRGNILLKQGNLDEAHINFEYVLRRDPNNEESLRMYGLIEPVREHVQMAFMLIEQRNYLEAIRHLTNAIEFCPWDPSLRETRAECHAAVSDMMAAIVDLKAVAKLRKDSTQVHHRISLLHYNLGEAEESLSESRECLKLDPDNKDCFPHYKHVKKLSGLLKSMYEYFASGNYHDCVEKANAIAKLESEVVAYKLAAKSLLCQCHTKGGDTLAGIKTCTEALEIEQNVELLCTRAEAHINNEEFDDAMSDYQRAHNLDQNAQCAREGLQRTQKLQKLAHRKDYYKILGVGRTATKKEIIKAYRKMAQKWHPDSFNGDEKKMAEKKFIDIAAAKEVLTNPELRSKFDNGEDPLDPESQSGQHFHHFNHGHGFGRGPFQFRFHFN